MTDDRSRAGADPLEDLRAELDAVWVSPKFADRVRERIANESAVDLGPIEAELAAQSVSPDFGAHVNERTAAMAASRARWPWLAGLAAAAVVALTWVGLSVRDVAVIPAVPHTADRTEPAPTPRMTDLASPNARAAEPRTREPRNPGTPEPALEVITNQPAILAELWARTARVETAQVIAPVESVPTPLEIDLATVEVTPVVVKWLVEPPPAMGFPLPLIVRIAAADAARRPE